MTAPFTLTSPTFNNNDTLPLAQVHNGAGGTNRSPELHWANPPAGTKSFALTCYDPDAPTGSGFWHWYIINLPAGIRSLETDENSDCFHMKSTTLILMVRRTGKREEVFHPV